MTNNGVKELPVVEPQEQFKLLKRSRGGHKAYATKIANETEELLKKVNADEVVDEIRTNKLILNEKIEVIRDLDDQILRAVVDDEEYNTEFATTSDYHRRLLKVLVAVDRWEIKQDENEAPVKKSGGAPSASHVRLAKLELKHFNGDPLQFQTFWDSFESAVERNSSLDDIAKFTYLKGVLDGKASLFLQGLTLTKENYKQAVELLKERFGDPQVIIQAHMDALLAISPVMSDKVADLRDICDMIEVHTRNLQLFDICAQNYGPVLISIIMSKLPTAVKLEISRQMPQGKWDIKQLMDALKKEIMSRERCASEEIPNQQPQEKYDSSSTLYTSQGRNFDNRSQGRNFDNRSQGRNFDNRSQGRNFDNNFGNQVVSCAFCKRPHFSSACRTVTSVEERKAMLRKKNKCYVCLKSNHIASRCQSKRTCRSCGNRHHEAICSKDNHNNQERTPSDISTLTTRVTNGQSNKSILLQTAQVLVYDSNLKDTSQVRLVFDNCSQMSFITSALRNSLKLPTIRSDTLLVKTFGCNAGKLQKCDVVNLKIRNRKNSNSNVIQVHVVPILSPSLGNQCITVAKEKHKVLEELELADDDSNGAADKDIDVLVGADYYWDFVTGRIKRTGDGLTAVHTTLGWVLNGRVTTSADLPSSTSLATTTHVLFAAETSLQSQLEKFWEVEEIGAKEPETFNSDEFLECIMYIGRRYSVPLPKREMITELSLNFGPSKKRLCSLLKDLAENKPDILKRYDDVIKQQEADHIIEKCEKLQPGVQTHYLPHRYVIKEDRETTKLRIVYDASSNKPSLNDCLEKGPNLLPLLLDVLIRFRCYKVALTSDIRQAFLNVAVNEEDRDLLRFLWVTSIEDLDVKNPELVVYRFARVLFGMKPSSYLLAAVIIKHLQSYPESFKEIVEYILRSLYVDDCMGGAADNEEAMEKYKALKEIFAAAGFDLKKWRSNDPAVQANIDRCEAEDSADGATADLDDIHKALGVNWNTKNDFLHVNTKDISDQGQTMAAVTRRNVLRTIASIYDPLGLTAPITVMLKGFFQKLCDSKYKWDEELNEDLKNEWEKLLGFLADDSIFEVNRYYFDSYHLTDVYDITLHGFCDASAKAYSAVVYITGKVQGGKRISALVVCKTKISPLKKITIPRLELCACLLLSNLLVNVQNAVLNVLDVKHVYCWSDALDALFWIKEENKKRCVFVENRARKIRKNVPSENWRHCPTDVNPADLPSRGIKSIRNAKEDYTKWSAGPEFIRKEETFWPADKSCNQGEKKSDDVTTKDSQNGDKDDRVSSEEETKAITCLHISDDVTSKKKKIPHKFENTNIEQIINVEQFSKLKKLLRVTAIVMRYVSNLKKRVNEETPLKGYVTYEEIESAERLWILSVQKSLESKSKQLNNTLGLQVDEHGIILCKGRLQNSNLSENQKNPILIPGNSHFARLLVIDAHKKTLHGGKKDTLVHLRSKFWVTHARKLINDVIRKCASPCNRLEHKAFKSMESSQLPYFRVQQSFPFTNSGVDYLGPLHVRQVYDSEDTSMHKVEVVLYTCAVTRAVHLDLVPDLSAASFLRSLKRFIGRRGIPNLMISDNATCFKNEEVKLSEEILNMGVKWRYIVEASPWWGGFWERLVQTVKRSLHKVLFRASVNYEELLTVLVEIEGVINSRPLTYVYNDEVDEVLTPAHLLLGRRLLSNFDVPFDEGNEIDNVILTKRMKYMKLLSDHYWQRFSDEYLMELRNRHQQGENPVRKPEVGEIVVIQGKTKRNYWRIGKIVRFIPSRDGNVRAVVVKVFDGSIIRYLKRPIERLHPIEVKSVCHVTNDEIENSKTIFDEPTYDEPATRSRRVAADNGVMLRRLMGHT